VTGPAIAGLVLAICCPLTVFMFVDPFGWGRVRLDDDDLE